MYVIGIAGGSCSGKSTLTTMLAENLKSCGYSVVTVKMDDYRRIPTPIATAPFTGIEYEDHDNPANYTLPDLNSFDNCDILIIDGLFTLYFDEIRMKLDLKVFVDLPSDERMVRRIKRFQMNKGLPLEEIAERFLDTVRYRHDEFVETTRWHADIIINGTLDSNDGSKILLQYIKGKVKK